MDRIDTSLLIDGGVNKLLWSEPDWSKIAQGLLKVRLKKSRVNFMPYGMKYNLPMLVRSKVIMVAKSGAIIKTIVYVVKGQT